MLKKIKMTFIIICTLVSTYLIISLILYFSQRNLLYHPNENNYSGDKITVEVIETKILTEDKTIIQDLIKAAFSNAKSQLKSKTSEEISKATGGFGIPGFKWPL